MYKPSLLFDRTPEQKRDIFKLWARDDQAFFAAGACHILAELFMQLHREAGYEIVRLKPAAGFPGNHIYVSNGVWAFDHNGWTKEQELLVITEQAYQERYPGWRYERIVIERSPTWLEDFCKAHKHWLPWQFAYLPWERAYKYIKQFEESPPKSSEAHGVEINYG